MLSFYEKEKQKYQQAFGIREEMDKICKSVGLQKVYDQFITPFNLQTSDLLEKAYVWLEQNYYSNLSNKWVLDVGCGFGGWVLKLENRGNFVVGLDLYKIKISFAQKFKELFPNKNFWFYEGNVYRLPFHPKWFDVCHSSVVIEHLITPVSGLNMMADKALEVTGIIHMGKNKEESPLHTYFYTKEEVRGVLDLAFDSYKISYIDNTFAMFIGKTKEHVPQQDKFISTIFQKSLEVIDIYPEYIPIDNIVSSVPVRMSVVEDYVECLKEGGIELFENPILPISLLQYPDETNKYKIVFDGTHRVAALKKYGKIEKIRAIITEVREVNNG